MIGFALTKEQLSTLLKMVFIANTIANSPDQCKSRNDFEEIESYIFERAKDIYPLAVFEHKVGNEKYHHPSVIFEGDSDVNQILDQYDDYFLPYLLAEKFGERDVIEEFGADVKDKMPAQQYENLVIEASASYEKIFLKYGVDALTVKPECLK